MTTMTKEEEHEQQRFFCENCHREVFLQSKYCDNCGGEIQWPKEVNKAIAAWKEQGKKAD